MKKIYDLGQTEIYCEIYKVIDSRMYILINENKALIVDPCISEDVVALLKERQIADILIILTHEHYDHISGVNYLRERFDVIVLASEPCSEMTIDPKKNRARYFEFLIEISGGDLNLLEYYDKNYICAVDETFESQKLVQWQGHEFELTYTPGHSKGSICILLDKKIVFTGDSLVNGHKVITKGNTGSKKDYLAYAKPYLDVLPAELMAFPGHGEIENLGKLRDEFGDFAI